MKTLADIKRRAQVGVAMTMVDYKINGASRPGAVVGITRKVKLVQSGAIQFEPHAEGKDGSWLYWPKAKHVEITGPDTFTVRGEPDDPITMFYRFEVAG